MVFEVNTMVNEALRAMMNDTFSKSREKLAAILGR